jgi:hypothetical protein
MPLEVASYIASLVETNPLASDDRSVGDDHLRLIKSCLKNSWPNITGAVTATHTTLNGLDARVTAVEDDYFKKDGSVTATDHFDMGSKRITNLASPTGDNDAVRLTDLSRVYPVGSLYLNASDATNPATLLGFGTWTEFGQGRVLIGVGEGTDENATAYTYAPGEESGVYLHTLTTAEIPSHNHANGSFDKLLSVTGTSTNTSSDSTAGEPNLAAGGNGSILAAGGGGAHRNDAPSIAIYMWLRTV